MIENTGYNPAKIITPAPSYGKQKETEPEKSKEQHKTDKLLPNDHLTVFRKKIEQASKIPKYTAEGLKGNQDANLFEFLQLGKIPYWIGGPMLVMCFAAGGKDGKALTKQKAAGVAMYYIAAIAAKAFIDGPVKFFKGIDLNRKYEDVIATSKRDEKGESISKTELHNVYESIDFTRWDLLYKNQTSDAAKNPDLVNDEYEQILLYMGLDKDLNDPDSTVRPYLTKTIAASRAWKSLMIVPLAGLALGLSTWKGWKDWGVFEKGFEGEWKSCFKSRPDETSWVKQFGIKSKNLYKKIISPLITYPLKESFKHLWKGDGFTNKYAKKFGGKLAILAPIAAVALANLNIIKISYLKKDKYVDIDNNNEGNLITRTFNDLTSPFTASGTVTISKIQGKF